MRPLTCYRVSQRFIVLAGDPELWKEKYYLTWVRPRARRLPGLKDRTSSATAFKHSSKLSKWLDDGHLVQRGRETNWKRQYRLRHNWSRGSCKVNELEVAHPSLPPVVVKFQRGIVLTVDTDNGLRAWSTKARDRLLASTQLTPYESSASRNPTSLGVDTVSSSAERMDLMVGFDDGSFCVYTLEILDCCFVRRFSHPPSSNGSITAIASATPYVLTMSQNKLLSLYRFPYSKDGKQENYREPRLLASLTSSAVWAPLSLSIRTDSSGIVACIAYALSRIGVGWSVGLQELRLTVEGESLGSRLTSTIESELDTLLATQSSTKTGHFRHQSVVARSAAATHTSSLPPPSTSPTSLSYSHPYLLASHPDNTLTIYLVVSDANSLVIKPGRRLWGHTSSVSGAQVSDRGKAVSVSAQGNEIRIWELEDLMTSTGPRKSEASVQLSPEKSPVHRDQDLNLITEAIENRGQGLGLALRETSNDLFRARGWVGFDEEQVVVLREKHVGTQILSCYDFT